MKMLSSEMTSLLDKLYNLRGEDSVILVSMDEEKQAAVETRDRTSALKSELQSKINDLTSEETVLAEEGERLKNALASIKKEEFATVIEHLNIDFDPEAIKNKVETALPVTIERVANEKQEAADELVQVEDEMNAAITKIEELGIRKDEALSNQSRLNNYFELALSSNINITRDEITSLLAKFNFSEEEQREAAKLLMFPEDGLFDYEKSFKERPISGKSIGEVIQEARETTPVVDFAALAGTKEPEAEPVIEDIKEPIIKIQPVEITQPVVEVPVVEPVITTPVLEPVITENASKDKLIELLTKLGFDYLDFTSNDFSKLLENYNETLISNNVALIEKLKMNKDVFVDNIELLYDTELESKIERLTSVGKAPQDIYLNPNVLVKYSLNELDSAIKTLHESGLEPKNVPLMAY